MCFIAVRISKPVSGSSHATENFHTQPARPYALLVAAKRDSTILSMKMKLIRTWVPTISCFDSICVRPRGYGASRLAQFRTFTR